MRKRFAIGLGALALTLVATQVLRAYPADEKPVQTVDKVDLQKYAGKWYEIARFPNRFQEDCAGEVTADYTLKPNGKIKVVNQCRKANGKLKSATGEARVASKDGSNSKLEVRFAPSWLSFLPAVWGDYWILDLADDYSYVLVGSPDRDYLWILARAPQLDEAIYGKLVTTARAQGFPAALLQKTRQQQ